MLSPDLMIGLAIVFYLAALLTVLFVLFTHAFWRAPVPLRRTVRTLMPLGTFSLAGFWALHLLSLYGISFAAASLLGEIFWALGIVVLAGGYIVSVFMFALTRGPRQRPLPWQEPPVGA
jgi:hypothetical protein